MASSSSLRTGYKDLAPKSKISSFSSDAKAKRSRLFSKCLNIVRTQRQAALAALRNSSQAVNLDQFKLISGQHNGSTLTKLLKHELKDEFAPSSSSSPSQIGKEEEEESSNLHTHTSFSSSSIPSDSDIDKFWDEFGLDDILEKLETQLEQDIDHYYELYQIYLKESRKEFQDQIDSIEVYDPDESEFILCPSCQQSPLNFSSQYFFKCPCGFALPTDIIDGNSLQDKIVSLKQKLVDSFDDHYLTGCPNQRLDFHVEEDPLATLICNCKKCSFNLQIVP